MGSSFAHLLIAWTPDRGPRKVIKPNEERVKDPLRPTNEFNALISFDEWSNDWKLIKNERINGLLFGQNKCSEGGSKSNPLWALILGCKIAENWRKNEGKLGQTHTECTCENTQARMKKETEAQVTKTPNDSSSHGYTWEQDSIRRSHSHLGNCLQELWRPLPITCSPPFFGEVPQEMGNAEIPTEWIGAVEWMMYSHDKQTK